MLVHERSVPRVRACPAAPVQPPQQCSLAGPTYFQHANTRVARTATPQSTACFACFRGFYIRADRAHGGRWQWPHRWLGKIAGN